MDYAAFAYFRGPISTTNMQTCPMKFNFSRILWIALLIGSAVIARAQQDTAIYQAVAHMPRFPACEELDTTEAVLQQCAEQALLNFMQQNIRYPQAAVQEEIEGMVVLTYIVERDGQITRPRLLRDIGGGCGEEALRVFRALQEYDLRFVPGRLQNGDTVRVQATLPVRFRIEEPLPYRLVESDTVYLEPDTLPRFRAGGLDGLSAFLQQQLERPAEVIDSCRIGQLDLELLVRSDGSVRVLEVTDYNGLGSAYWDNAIQAATATYGKWDPARYQGRPVGASLLLNMPFFPEGEVCAQAEADYFKAHELAGKVRAAYGEEDSENALTEINRALELLPGDARLLALRGEIYLEREDYEAACADLRAAKEIALWSSYDAIIQLFCR
jgi:tetratricopeptide (TPR) repeat protein